MPKAKKGSDTDWKAALETPKERPPAEEKRVLHTEIPAEALEDLRDLARYRSRKEGRKVTMADLIVEGIRDLMAKYVPKRKGN